MRLQVPAGLRDILPGLGSESREELRERDMVNVENEERMSLQQHLKGSRTFDCPTASPRDHHHRVAVLYVYVT